MNVLFFFFFLDQKPMDHLVSLFGESLILQSKPSIKKKNIVELEKVKFECVSWPYLLFYFFILFFIPSSKTPRTDGTEATSLDSRG